MFECVGYSVTGSGMLVVTGLTLAGALPVPEEVIVDLVKLKSVALILLLLLTSVN